MSDHDEIPPILLAETAAAAARAAGDVLLARWGERRRVQFKGDINLVTDADHQAEATVAGVLRARFPDHEILAEEGTAGGASSIYRWIVDPLDGTTNYAHGYPHFAVSVAAERAGVVVAGAVHDPILDELFEGWAGGGAFLNRRPLRVSSVASLLHALVATGFPYDRALFDATLRRFSYFVRRCQAVRRDGSAALNVCYVAAGRFDAFWEDHLGPWDIAAAMLIAKEAGGTVTNFQGGAADIYRGDLVVSNAHLHPAMLMGTARDEGP